MPPPAKVASPAVLVLDADQGSALAIVRSLGRSGVVVTCASATTDAIAAYSRHSAGHLLYPDPLTQEDAFISWLQDRQNSHGTELTFPVTERTVVPMNRHSDRLDRSRLALAPADALEQVLDKSRTVALAQSLGVQVPKSITLRPQEALPQLEQLEAPWGYPVVVKPARSVGQAQQGGVHLSVAYARNDRELRNHVQHLLRYGEVILQEYFTGAGVGVELIADNGEVQFAFQHRRLHEVPLTGGGSSLRCSEAVAPPLLEAARRLMKALNWHGVAMVEFKFQPQTGDYRLMEINGRFWGSLPLATAAGADFPVMLHELMSQGRVRPRTAARHGVVCRQLARDIDWLEHVARRAAPEGLAVLPSWSQVLRDTALVFSPRHHFDIQSLRDIRPGLVDLRRLIRKQWQRLRRQRQARLRLRGEQTAAQSARVQRLPAAQHLLFLCYGNINRSALAHAYARTMYGSAGRTFDSAGFHEEEGRPADPLMVQAAGACGVGMHDWTSKRVSQSMVTQSDLILAMEAAHVDRLLALYPEAAGKVFLLGALAPSTPEIPDPYGAAPQTYEAVCRRVRLAVDSWLGPSSGKP